MPPRPSSASGCGASRVHSTTPSGAGSPEATPRVNGSACTGLWRRSVVNPARGSAASATAPFSTARRLGRKPPGDTDTTKCQRAVFRDGDGQPYGVRLRRCCCANRLCTLPFRVTNDSYRDGVIRGDIGDVTCPALRRLSISETATTFSRPRAGESQDGAQRGLCFAGPGDADREDSAFRDGLFVCGQRIEQTVCVKRRNFGDAKPSRSAECCRTGFLRPQPTYAADNPFQP